MLRRLSNQCLLRPSDFKASQPDLEVIGAFNPGAIATDDGVVLLVRIAEEARERRPGKVSFPRWDPASKRTVIDWHEEMHLNPLDIRVVKRKQDGLARLTFISHLRVVKSRDGRTIDSIEEIRLEPANEYEEFGVEDPRITRLNDKYYITYVAVSRHGVATALASTKDFRFFERHGIIFYPENKDVVLFPEKINGSYHALHRPNGATPFTKPEIWLAKSPDLIHWGEQQHFLGGSTEWDIGRIGAGTPPIRTEAGWLAIYHGNSKREEEKGIGIYSGGLLLLDLENPCNIRGASGRVFLPQTDFEIQGFVPNVVFPTGIVQQGDSLLVYYGAADTSTALVEFSLTEALGFVKPRSP